MVEIRQLPQADAPPEEVLRGFGSKSRSGDAELDYFEELRKSNGFPVVFVACKTRRNHFRTNILKEQTMATHALTHGPSWDEESALISGRNGIC